MELDRLLESLEGLKEAARADAVFGEAETIGEKTIIPVARVSYGFGMGFGRGGTPATEEDPEGEGEGGGGGGGASVVPMAILEVTPEETKLTPVVDTTRLAALRIFAVACSIFFIAKALGKLAGPKG